jgi:UPF0716 protein FxsA
MLSRIMLAITVGSLVELTLLLLLGRYAGVPFTLLFVIGTMLLGTLLLRRQSWRAWKRVRDELNQGQVPAESLADGLLVVVAAVLLMLPGVLTDVVGFLLLVPAFRRRFRHALRAWLRRRIEQKFGPPAPGSRKSVEVIDSYVVTNRSEDGRPDGPEGTAGTSKDDETE